MESPVRLFAYQERCVSMLVDFQRGVAVAPARSGKTIIGGHAVLRVVEASDRPLRLLWICNTTEQKQQAIEALECLRPVRDKVMGWVRHFSHVDSVPLETIDILVVDECHHAPADFWTKAIKRCTSARWIWGLTATPHREDGLWAAVEDIIGPVVAQVTPQDVASEGMRVVPSVEFHGVASEDCMLEEVERAVDDEWPARERVTLFRCKKTGEDIGEALEKARRQLTHQKAIELGLCKFEPRTGATIAVARDAVARGRIVLVLVYSVEQGRAVMDGVEGSRIVFSRMKVREDGRRAEIVDAFRSGHLRCLIATSLADEGLNVPRADCLVLAGGGRGVSKEMCAITGEKRATSKIEQRTARVLTAIDGKDGAEVHDFMDNCHGMLRAASWSRMKAYRMLGYNCQPMPAAPRVEATVEQMDMLSRKGAA